MARKNPTIPKPKVAKVNAVRIQAKVVRSSASEVRNFAKLTRSRAKAVLASSFTFSVTLSGSCSVVILSSRCLLGSLSAAAIVRIVPNGLNWYRAAPAGENANGSNGSASMLSRYSRDATPVLACGPPLNLRTAISVTARQFGAAVPSPLPYWVGPRSSTPPLGG